MPKVNPELLVWARETAGLERDDAARRIGLTDGKYKSALRKLEALENGEVEPSQSILRNMSDKYRRSLVAFYLAAPPPRGERGTDFRAPSSRRTRREDALVDALIRDVYARQSIIRSALEDDEDASSASFIGSLSASAGQDRIVQALRELLRMNLTDYRRRYDTGEAFEFLRGVTNAAGVFVLLQGNLGSHHTAISPSVFRGFSLADDLAPFVVINDRDAKGAWSFTLLHELVHLLFGQSGIDGGHSDQAIEQLCDRAAGEFLLPGDEIEELNINERTDFKASAEAISSFADTRKVSSSMVTYKAYAQGMIGREQYRNLTDHFYATWQENRVRGSGGGSYYTTRRHRLGSHLIGIVRRMVQGDQLTISKAARVLAVKPTQVYTVFGE